MTIAVKLLNDQIKKISETNTLLDMLLEFEKYSGQSRHLQLCQLAER